nr:PAS domain S-box protein [bacterium]
WLMLDDNPVMTIDMSKSLNKPVIYFAAKVKNQKSGKQTGTVVLRMSAEKIREIIQTLNFNASIKVELIDQSGMLIYSSFDKQGLMKQSPLKNKMFKIIRETGKNSGYKESVIDNNSITVYSTNRGFMGYRTANWILTYHIQNDIFTAPALKIVNYSVIFFSAVLIAVLLLIYGYINILIKPLSVLNNAAHELSSGNLNIHIKESTGDETGTLAKSFNTMARKLKESFKKIESQNEELNAANEELTATNEELTASNEELQTMTEELQNSNEELQNTTEELRCVNEELLSNKKLLEQKSFLETLINTMPMAVYYKNNERKYIGFNKKFEDFCGLDSGKILGKSVFDVFSEKDALELNKMDSLLFEKKGKQIFERQINMNGKFFDVIIYKSVFEIQDTGKYGIVGGILDITDIKEIEKNLLKANARLKELEYIINRSNVVVLVSRFDENFSIEYVSDNVRNFGYTPEEIYSSKTKTREIISENDFNRIVRQVENYIKNGIDEFILHYRAFNKKGETRYIEDRTNLIKDVKGNITHFQGILIDVTERYLAEKEVQSQQIQLIQSGKLAALGQVVAGVAHEINNPNSLISLNAPLLEEYIQELKPLLRKIDDSNYKIKNMSIEEAFADFDRIIKSIQTGSDRIKVIVNNLKEFSRDSDETKKNFYSVKEIIEKSFMISEGFVKKKVKTIEFDVEKNLPLLYCNLIKMEQVFINLIANAAEAIKEPEKGIIKIKCAISGDNFEFRIKDNGAGIPEKFIEKIFEPFFTTKISEGGTGLGLSIVWGIIKERHGEIFVNSKEGEGTEFVIKLPLKKNNEADKI